DAGITADERIVADASARNDRTVTGNGVAIHGAAAADQCQVLRHSPAMQLCAAADTGFVPTDGIIIEPGVVVALRQVGFALHKTAKIASRHIILYLPQCTDAVKFRVDGVSNVGNFVFLVRLRRLQRPIAVPCGCYIRCRSFGLRSGLGQHHRDGKVLRLPEMDVEYTFRYLDIALLEAFSPAIRILAASSEERRVASR